jgi:hypothetical protein
MAYAALTFTSSVSYQQALHDIIGCVTGAYTTTSQFKYATGTLVRGGGDWTIAYAPASVTYNSGTYNSSFNHVVLSATCTTVSKTKYAHLGTWGPGYVTSDTATLGRSNIYTSGLFITAATAASSAIAITNETYRQTYSSENSSYCGIFAQGITFYLSWSSKHLVWYNNSMNSLVSPILQGVIEFPEVTKTTSLSTLPVIWMHCAGSYSSGTTYTSSDQWINSTVPAMQSYNQSTTGGSVFIFPTLTTDSVSNAVSNYKVTAGTNDYLYSPFMGSGGVISYLNTENFSVLASDGSNKTLTTPMLLSGLTFGYDMMDLTAYTSIYTVPLGNTGDTIAISGQDYAVLNVNGKRFLFKKG